MDETLPELVAVCHPRWRGIRNSTYALTAHVIEASEIDSSADAERVASCILKKRPRKVLLSGYPRGYDLLAKTLKENDPAVRIFFLSHAPFTWYSDRPEETLWFQRMLGAHMKGYIEKVGFCKRDPAQYFKERGLNTYFVMNRPPAFDKFRHTLNSTCLNIGVWGSNMWHRNLLNQVLGGLTISDCVVHCNELPEYFFLDENRIRRHGILEREEYTTLMRSMDINLYVSFTDCFPMTLIESMAYGIPCLASDTSDVYRWSEYLKMNLLVSKIDSPIAIGEQIRSVLDNYSTIQEEMALYVPILSVEIEKSIAEFLA